VEVGCYKADRDFFRARDRGDRFLIDEKMYQFVSCTEDGDTVYVITKNFSEDRERPFMVLTFSPETGHPVATLE
jgi:hypothetical protein